MLQVVINGLIRGILLSLVAIGFALAYNTTRVFHIAAAALYVFAAYMMHWAATKLGLPILVAGLAAVGLTMILSLFIELTVYHPLKKRNASNEVAMIASIGLMTVIIPLLVMGFGSATKKFGDGMLPSFQVGHIDLTTPQMAQLLIGATAVILFLVFISMTSWGMRLRALSTDEALYETLGYSTRRSRVVAFLLSGAYIALASCLSAYDIGINPDMGMDMLISAMVAMVIGGVGRFGTCVAGGLVLGVLQAVTAYEISDNWKTAVTFIILILLLFLRPQGLAGIKTRTV